MAHRGTVNSSLTLSPSTPGLGEADVMGVCRRSPANEAGLPGNEAQMVL